MEEFINYKWNDSNKIKETLERLKKTDWSHKLFDSIINEFREGLGQLPIFCITLKKDQYLCKARINGNKPPFNYLHEISIIPDEFVKSFGRANLPGQGIFYCSNLPETAVREVTQWHINDTNTLLSKKIINIDWNQHAQIITTSLWKVKEDLNLASLLFHDNATINNELFKMFHDSLYIEDSEVARSKKEILEFFSREFARSDIKNQFDYIFSAYYAYEMYNYSNSTKEIDGLVYSSVANQYEGENFALTKEALRKLEFKTAFLNYTFNSDKSPINGQRTRISDIKKVSQFSNDGKLTWEDC